MDSVNGFLKGIFLASVLQLMELERKSCKLIIRENLKLGFLFISDGFLIDALTENKSGRTAALDILCWDDVEISIDGLFDSIEPKIFSSNSELLLEAYRIKDEMIYRELVLKRETTSKTNGPPQNIFEKLVIVRPAIQAFSTTNELVEILLAFSSIEGFQGLSMFTKKGQEVCRLEVSHRQFYLNNLGCFVDRVLSNNESIVSDLGVGCDQITHVISDDSFYFLVKVRDHPHTQNSENHRQDLQIIIAIGSQVDIWRARREIEYSISHLSQALVFEV